MQRDRSDSHLKVAAGSWYDGGKRGDLSGRVLLTGRGSTRTCMDLLKRKLRDDEAFLVIEPGSNRYRTLLPNNSLANRLRIYTPGNPVVAPLAVNPLQIIPGVSVASHIGRVVEIFRQCYELSAPAEHALELCIAQSYVDRGWSISANSSWRLSDDTTAVAFVPELQPTLEDVLGVVKQTVDRCDFATHVKTDIKTILNSVLGSLLFGQQKMMLADRSSTSIEQLFEHPTIIELAALGSEPGKSFIVAVLLLFLEEARQHKRADDESDFLLVLEDSQRLHSLWGAARGAGDRPVVWLETVVSSLTSCGTKAIVIADELRAAGLKTIQPETPRKTGAKSASGTGMKSAAGCSDLMVQTAMSNVIAENPSIDCTGCTYWPGGFDARTHDIADQVVSDYDFRMTFYKYVLSVLRDITQLVYFRKHLIESARRVLGNRFSPEVFWCAFTHTSEHYFAAKAREYFWSLELERSLKSRWLDFMIPAFVVISKNRLDTGPIKQWRDDFLQAHLRGAGPLTTCGGCQTKCLYRLEVSELTNPSVQFDFNCWINKKDVPAHESAAWFARLLSERCALDFDPGLAFCIAVHCIKQQSLSDDAQINLLEMVRAQLDEFEGQSSDDPEGR